MTTHGACHRCQKGVMKTDEDGAMVRSPEFEGMEYADLPCANCKLLHGDSIHGDIDAQNNYMNKTSIDSLTGECGTDFDKASRTMWGDEREDWTDSEALQGMTVGQVTRFFADFVRFFIRMTPKTQRVVCNWLRGRQLLVAASELGCSEQAAHRRLGKAHADFPNLRAVRSILRAK